MLCPSCNNFRPATNAPCPICQGPSPLAGDAWGAASNNNWANPPGQLPFSSTSWPDIPDAATQQWDFPTANQSPFTRQPEASGGTLWTQMMSPSAENPGASAASMQPQSLLPVPYQQQMGVMPTRFSNEIQTINPLLPALPDSGEGAPVFVAPMYTKPRPLIPRYRAISGLLSVLVVFGMLCAGSAYYAQVSGKISGIQKLFGTYAPSSLAATQHALAVPTTRVIDGPASSVITSVAIGNTIDKENGLVPNYVNEFSVDQEFWLSCSVHASKPGSIMVQWYTNNNRWLNSSRDISKANLQSTADFPQSYAQPSEGKVEIYWSGKLAETLLFVVQPLAA
jgi:hypothetical protein